MSSDISHRRGKKGPQGSPEFLTGGGCTRTWWYTVVNGHCWCPCQWSEEHWAQQPISRGKTHIFPIDWLLPISSEIISLATPCMWGSTAAPQQGAGFELPRVYVWLIPPAVLILQHVCLFIMGITVRGISKQAFTPVWDWACALTVVLIFNKRATTACLH